MADIPNPPLDIDALVTSTLMQVARETEKDLHSDLEDLAAKLRDRVASGDTGTPAPGTTAPGWGGGVSSWLPWVGAIVVAGVVGTAVGASGLIGAPVEAPDSGPVGYVVGTAPAASCPGGPIVDELHAGDRVLAVERSDDSTFLGVRDPREITTVLWLPASVLTLDPGQQDVSSLPVGACPNVVQTYVTPTPEPIPEPEPEPVDSTRPTIGQAGSSTGTVYVQNNGTAIISATASDNVGVASVSISWTGSTSGSAAMQFAGGTWSYLFDPPQDTPAGTVTFTIQARDAAGNVSTPATVNVQTVP